MSAANSLTKAVISYIKMMGGAARRVNTMGIPMKNGKWRKSGMKKGFEDVTATIPIKFTRFTLGLTVAIEVKIGKDKQSEEQKVRQKEVEEAGGIYIVAKDIVQFQNDLKTLINRKIKS